MDVKVVPEKSMTLKFKSLQIWTGDYLLVCKTGLLRVENGFPVQVNLIQKSKKAKGDKCDWAGTNIYLVS